MAASIKSRFAEALRLQNAGQSDAALALYTGIVLERPETAEAHFQIGRIHAAAGRLPKARQALLTALQHRPEERAIWDGLRSVVPTSAQTELCADIIRDFPADTLGHLGAALRSWGFLTAASDILSAAVDGGANAARLPLALLLRDMCQVPEAEAVLAKAAPKSDEEWFQLALLRARLRQAEPARKAMDRAVKAGVNPVRASIDLSGVLARENEGAAAIAVLDAAIRRHPKRGALYGQRGQLAQSRGALEAAQADLQRALALDPLDAEAIRAYFAATKAQADDPILAKCEVALSKPGLPDAAQYRLHFAMAKALTDLGRHDEVFAHLHKANALQKKEFPFDFDQAVAQSRAILQAVRRDLVGQTPEGASDPVIFVAGLPRSGTTLVENVLAAHPAVTAGGELPLLVDALRPVGEHIEHGVALSTADFAGPAARYLAAAHRRLGTEGAFTDKSVATPYRIGLAAYALPDARFILPRRDPRDIGLSIYRNMFAGGQQRFSTDLFEIGRMIRLHDAMVAAWAELFPDRMHFVDYEALTEDPEPHIRATVAAAGLPWDDACLAPHQVKRRVDTLSFAQVRQPIYRSAVAGWRRHADDLAPLEEGLRTQIDLSPK